jgi:hypothetical protein
MVNFENIIKNLNDKELNPKEYVTEDIYLYSDIILFLEKFREKLKNNFSKLNLKNLEVILEETKKEIIEFINKNLDKYDPESKIVIKERIKNFEDICKKINENLLESYQEYLKNKNKKREKSFGLKIIESLKKQLE